MNKVVLLGRLQNSPKFSHTAGGIEMATFPFFTEYEYKGETKRDEFYIKCYGKLAVLADKYFKPGQEVFIDGKLHNIEFTNADGNKVYGYEVIVKEMDAFPESKASYENYLAEHPEFVKKEPMPDDDGFYSEDFGNMDSSDLPFS